MKKVVTFGELMLRLTPPAREMILQTPNMVCTFGGAEANVAVAVSQYGDEARYVTGSEIIVDGGMHIRKL